LVCQFGLPIWFANLVCQFGLPICFISIFILVVSEKKNKVFCFKNNHQPFDEINNIPDLEK